MVATGFTPQTMLEGRYQLDAPLDAWGLGETWLARDKNFRGRPVAVSFLPAESSDTAATLAGEFRAQRAIKHPSVGTVINHGATAGFAWVAFDHFDGVSLARFVEEQRRTRASVDRATAEGIADKLVDALCAAHEAATPLLHGCLHPACVIVKNPALKVVDFGLGACFGADALGPFRAPEQTAGADGVTLASDVYALGVVLADLLMPQTVGDARRALEALVAAMAREGGAQAGKAQRADIPVAVWEAIARAVRRDPATRWDDVASLRDALRAGWASAASPGAPAPLAAPRPATMAGVPLPRAAPAPPAFTAPPAPAPAPAAAFSGPLPFVGAPAPAPSPSAWASPAGHGSVRAALASAWESPSAAVPLPPPPSAAHASAWDAGDASPHWGSPAPTPSQVPYVPPMAGARPSDDNEWDEQTRASENPARAATGYDAARARLASMPQESTMAFDLDALGGPGPAPAPAPSVSASGDDDWKDSVVVLNTATSARTVGNEDDDGVREPGGRTRVGQAAGNTFDSMATVRPPQRAVGVAPFVPQPASPHMMYGELPANQESTFVTQSPLVSAGAPVSRPPASFADGVTHVSERTMAIDVAPSEMNATVRAPSGSLPAAQFDAPPPTPRRPTELRAPPPQPSRTPVYAAVVVALLLIGAAIAIALARRSS